MPVHLLNGPRTNLIMEASKVSGLSALASGASEILHKFLFWHNFNPELPTIIQAQPNFTIEATPNNFFSFWLLIPPNQ